MHFTIDYKRLIKMLELAKRKWPGQAREKQVRLYACAARVFVEGGGMVSGEEALVLVEGGCLLRLKPFLAMLKTYPNKENVTIQAAETSLRFFTTSFPILEYTSAVKPPADFVLEPVTDTWVAGSAACGASRPQL